MKYILFVVICIIICRVIFFLIDSDMGLAGIALFWIFVIGITTAVCCWSDSYCHETELNWYEVNKVETEINTEDGVTYTFLTTDGNEFTASLGDDDIELVICPALDEMEYEMLSVEKYKNIPSKIKSITYYKISDSLN